MISIVGATGTGKSALAVELGQRIGGEVINADALQVYRGLDIGTAKPSSDERARIRHHLVDVLDATEPYSAGEFARLARQAIADIRSRGRVPLVVGGSGLYQRALLEGLAPVPAIPLEIRARLRTRLREEGLAVLLSELREVDPEGAARLSVGDTQRVLRALEVRQATGRTLGWWQAQEPEYSGIAALRIGLTVPRSILYDNLRFRVRQMIDRGWLEEVEALLGPGGEEAETERLPPAFQAIGYRQLISVVRGESALEAAVESTIRETRRYAKRQETWFRRERDVHWFRAERALSALPEMIELFSRLGRGS